MEAEKQTIVDYFVSHKYADLSVPLPQCMTDYYAVVDFECTCEEGVTNFQNEIIWLYKTGGATKTRFSRKHDNIFFYTKSKAPPK